MKLQQYILWLVGVIVVALIVVGVSLAINQQTIVGKFEPIAFLPPAATYNLDLASAEVKTAYGQLEQAYIALAKNPTDVDAALARANAYLAIKDTARAILAYQWVNRQYPSNVQGWSGLANIYATVGRTDDAKTMYQTALKLDPSNPDLQNKMNKLEGNQ
ncbi:MAG: tetratricopeptide repeat protein [bacterium]